MKSNVLERINEIRIQREQDQIISNLTCALLFQTRIDAGGKEMICWLTKHPANTNRDALKLWVYEQLQTIEFFDEDNLIKKLSQRLYALMADIQENS